MIADILLAIAIFVTFCCAGYAVAAVAAYIYDKSDGWR